MAQLLQKVRADAKRDVNPLVPPYLKAGYELEAREQGVSMSKLGEDTLHACVAHVSLVDQLSPFFIHAYFQSDNQWGRAWLARQIDYPLKLYVRRLQTLKRGEEFTRFHIRLHKETFYLLTQIGSATEVSDPSTLALFLLAWRLPHLGVSVPYYDVLQGEWRE